MNMNMNSVGLWSWLEKREKAISSETSAVIKTKRPSGGVKL